MRKVGDIITWNGKSGKMTGEIVRVRIRCEYFVLVEPEREKVVLITEDER